MNGLQLTLWLGAVALVLWHWRHERVREECSRPSEDVTTDRVASPDHAE